MDDNNLPHNDVDDSDDALVATLRALCASDTASSSPAKPHDEAWLHLVDQLQQYLGRSTDAPPPPSAGGKMGPSTTRRLSPDQVNAKWHGTLDRFTATQLKVQHKLAKQRAVVVAAQSKDLVFTPRIDAKSKKIASHFPDFHERQRNTVAWRDNHVAAEREQKRLQEMEAVRSMPDTKTPCVCGQGPSSHSDTCLRFMQICAAANASFKIHKKTRSMRRSVDDMLAYGDTKHVRLVERVVAQEAAEALEATFTPRINPQSKKVVPVDDHRTEHAMSRYTRQWSKLGGDARTSRLRHTANPTAALCTFKPSINRKSKALSDKHTDRTSVFDRLEKHADERIFKQLQADITSVDSTVRHAKQVKVGRDDTQAKRLLQQYPDCPASPTRAQPPSSTIDADAEPLKCEFILANFTNGQAILLPKDSPERKKKSSFQASVEGNNTRRSSIIHVAPPAFAYRHSPQV
ncbi:Aste57867_15686 [Aphanomyces stellatus]|uniref:Aste57867_15686 protein n=1 Tax=Aphanomyces stellatus TaxID=120398 RepID=A0A485L4A1_9STRA|nr:hypothetical protein As57867_015630 [Aphanomyces stellatus]VFT92479.1 Aste57867_15686 [Aphanomyces stellatus]